MERHYDIGGHRFRVTGEASGSAKDIPGFEVFETMMLPAALPEPEFTIRLERNGPEAELSSGTKPPFGAELPAAVESNVLYTFAFDDTECTFARPAAGGYTFCMTSADRELPDEPLKMYCYPTMRECVITGNRSPRLLRFALWMAYGMLTAARQTVLVHSSVIACGGRAVLFLGESGTGKSTHTRLWRKHIPDTTLLNDDSPVLRVVDGTPFVYGSPWSGKAPCFRNERMELAGIVRLSQAPHNRIRRLPTVEAVGALFPSCPPAFARDEMLSEHICNTLSEVLSRVPVYHLSCLPDAEAARLSFRTVFPSATEVV